MKRTVILIVSITIQEGDKMPYTVWTSNKSHVYNIKKDRFVFEQEIESWMQECWFSTYESAEGAIQGIMEMRKITNEDDYIILPVKII